ncbi:hypothetical protein CC86DRAFT_374029 [Ophiobolus disseminans]|uniref:Uncharacterized protein n=1 Tax=Ophiobolus disseminans TaxID=1469910 RepID=A0A6A6ZLP6_9PLEO|nr:hypothetical protein CC86DRAFT_374029 [Ophiobolus disseminans]
MLSRLESLPAELLQPILLYSKNISLPFCSHIIGAKLSNEEAFREISIPKLFGTGSLDDYRSPGDYPNRSLRGGDLALTQSPQSRILSAKFMTPSRFKLYLELAWKRVSSSHSVAPDKLVAILFALPLETSRKHTPLLKSKPDCPELSCFYFETNLAILRNRATIPPKLLKGKNSDDDAYFLHCLLRCGLRKPPYY